MDHDVAMFAQVMIVIVLSTASLAGIGLVSRVLWRMGSQSKPRVAERTDDSRLQRLEIAIEAIAVEVERISEGQRFTTALLSERLPGRAGERAGELPPAGGARRSNTPH